MSQRSLLEFNHDLSPEWTGKNLESWAEQLRSYLRSGREADLPQGVTLKHRRHHSDSDPTGDRAPRFQPVPVTCGRCGHGWTAHIAVHCSIALAAASMKVLADDGCPKCEATGDNVLLAHEPG